MGYHMQITPKFGQIFKNTHKKICAQTTSDNGQIFTNWPQIDQIPKPALNSQTTNSTAFLRTGDNEAGKLTLEPFSARKQKTYVIAAKCNIKISTRLQHVQP